MIDLHCHLLPGLDDGPSDIADTVAMARQAATDGIEVICATPHIRDDHDVGIAELEALVAVANARLEQEDVPVRIAQGGEIAAERSIARPTTSCGRSRSGVGGRWLLVEPRPGPLDDHLVDVVDRLAHRGFQRARRPPGAPRRRATSSSGSPSWSSAAR